MILIFDLMDTLLFDPFYENFFSKLSSTQKKLWIQYKNHEQYILFEEGRILENEYFRNYYKEKPSNLNLISGQKMKKLMLNNIQYLPDIDKLLLRIKKIPNIYLILASNYSIWYHEIFNKKKELENYFDYIFFSCEIGYRKPHENFFKTIRNTALEELKNKEKLSDEILFFDDNKENCNVAIKFGWNAIWIHDKFLSAKIISNEIIKKVPAFFNAGK